MDTTIFEIDQEPITAQIMSHMCGEEVTYHFEDTPAYTYGAILVQPARFGIHPCSGGVKVTFGGYDGCFEIGDWAVVGSVVCRDPDMIPGPDPTTTRGYPIGQVRADDRVTAELLSELVRVIADHYAEHYTGIGLR